MTPFETTVAIFADYRHKRTLRRWTAVDYRPCVGDAFAFRNLLTPTPLAVRASKKGGGFQNLHFVTGYPLV
jgi:hypothetical protein